MAYTLDVNLQGHEYDKCAEQEGYGKSFEPLPDKLSACPVTQGIVYTETRKEKEKRHDPLSHEIDRYRHDRIQLVVLYVPVIVIKELLRSGTEKSIALPVLSSQSMSWRLSGLFLALAGFSEHGVCRIELDSCTSCWSNSPEVTGAFIEPDVCATLE